MGLAECRTSQLEADNIAGGVAAETQCHLAALKHVGVDRCKLNRWGTVEPAQQTVRGGRNFRHPALIGLVPGWAVPLSERGEQLDDVAFVVPVVCDFTRIAEKCQREALLW
jgi:hypothetical protein